MNMPSRVARGLVSVALALVTSLVVAQEYPAKTIRLVVPFPPGGVADNMARAYSQELQKSWGQSIVVDNRPGAGTTIAADNVAKSPADGYTIYLTNIGHSSSAAFYSKLPYDAEKDFAPVTILFDTPSILAATPSLPANNVKELIALAKAKPKEINFASAGNGTASHLFAENLKVMAGIDIVHIPYKGTAPALVDLMSGAVHVIFEPMGTMLPHIRSGKLKSLGITTAKRVQAAPDIPTIAESGLPGFDMSTWYGILVPAGTPPAVIKKLHGELVRITRLPEMKERLTAQGAESVANTPEQFSVIIKNDIQRWSMLIKRAGISLN